LLAFLCTALVTGTGCSSSGARDVVSGKVTVSGQNVSSGQIKFLKDGKEAAMGPILNGDYQIENPPKGEVDVVITGQLGGEGPLKRPPGAVGGAKEGGNLQGDAKSGGVNPPPKYGMPNNGLKFTVTGGKQKKDWDLTP